MFNLNNNGTQLIKKHGFVVIHNVFSKKEIKSLRQNINYHFHQKGVLANAGFTQPNAAVEVPQVSWVFYHPKILAVLRQLFEQDHMMFTSHCDIHSGTLSGWHKDDGTIIMEGGYFGYPTYDREDCRVYKVALYLQDHYFNTGGLTVRKGSHQYPELDRGEELYVPTKAGDIIVFDVRLTHTGQRETIPVPILQQPLQLIQQLGHKLFKIPPAKVNQFYKKTYDKLAGRRLSIFFTYGLPNTYTINFAINNMKRQIQQDRNSHIFLAAEVRQKFLDSGTLLAEDYFTQLQTN